MAGRLDPHLDEARQTHISAVERWDEDVDGLVWSASSYPFMREVARGRPPSPYPQEDGEPRPAPPRRRRSARHVARRASSRHRTRGQRRQEQQYRQRTGPGSVRVCRWLVVDDKGRLAETVMGVAARSGRGLEYVYVARTVTVAPRVVAVTVTGVVARRVPPAAIHGMPLADSAGRWPARRIGRRHSCPPDHRPRSLVRPVPSDSRVCSRR